MPSAHALRSGSGSSVPPRLATVRFVNMVDQVHTQTGPYVQVQVHASDWTEPSLGSGFNTKCKPEPKVRTQTSSLLPPRLGVRVFHTLPLIASTGGGTLNASSSLSDNIDCLYIIYILCKASTGTL
jgi:hypothetical protein